MMSCLNGSPNAPVFYWPPLKGIPMPFLIRILTLVLTLLFPLGLWAQEKNDAFQTSLVPSTVRMEDFTLKNQLTFYDDNEEFQEPFRAEQSLAGIQFLSALAVSTGNTTGFRAGFFVDDGGPDTVSVKFKPILSFEYHTDTSRLLMGTIDNTQRHGFIAPLENETLEITRPVEYGLQWMEKEEGFNSDVYLDWQQVDQPGQDEIFDYGGVLKAAFSPQAAVVMQFHGYHEGGRIFNLRVINNYNPALGIKLRENLGFLGESRFDLFAVASSDFEGKFDIGPDWGRGIYARGSITPGGWVEFYGLYWTAQDFFSQEGDPNYNSQGTAPSFYRSNRVYVEAGLRENLVLDSGIRLDAEAKSAWVDEFWGWALRLTAQVPFDLNLSLSGEAATRKEGPDAL
jgi:hypothetical protein